MDISKLHLGNIIKITLPTELAVMTGVSYFKGYVLYANKMNTSTVLGAYVYSQSINTDTVPSEDKVKVVTFDVKPRTEDNLSKLSHGFVIDPSWISRGRLTGDWATILPKLYKENVVKKVILDDTALATISIVRGDKEPVYDNVDLIKGQGYRIGLWGGGNSLYTIQKITHKLAVSKLPKTADGKLKVFKTFDKNNYVDLPPKVAEDFIKFDDIIKQIKKSNSKNVVIDKPTISIGDRKGNNDTYNIVISHVIKLNTRNYETYGKLFKNYKNTLGK